VIKALKLGYLRMGGWTFKKPALVVAFYLVTLVTEAGAMSQGFAPDLSPAVIMVQKMILLAVCGLVAIVLIDKHWPEKKRKWPPDC
jgi:hypothetical protein